MVFGIAPYPAQDIQIADGLRIDFRAIESAACCRKGGKMCIRDRGNKWAGQFIVRRPCEVCGGTRLKDEALHFRIAGRNIAEVSAMSIEEFARWVDDVPAPVSYTHLDVYKRQSFP